MPDNHQPSTDKAAIWVENRIHSRVEQVCCVLQQIPGLEWAKDVQNGEWSVGNRSNERGDYCPGRASCFQSKIESSSFPPVNCSISPVFFKTNTYTMHIQHGTTQLEWDMLSTALQQRQLWGRITHQLKVPKGSPSKKRLKNHELTLYLAFGGQGGWMEKRNKQSSPNTSVIWGLDHGLQEFISCVGWRCEVGWGEESKLHWETQHVSSR